MVYRVYEILNGILSRPILDDVEYSDSFIKSAYLVKNSLMNYKISLIQGPPGTGKTKVFTEVIKDVLNVTPENDLIIYIAPTNELVAQMLQRVAVILKTFGYANNVDTITRMVRVYGSQFDFKKCEKMNQEVNKETRIVITTEYQRVSGRWHANFHFLIDEASRSLLHQPFITSSRNFIERLERGETMFGSVNVIGDPMQAIVLGEEYKRSPRLRRERLVIEAFVSNLLKAKGVEVSDDPNEMMLLANKYLRGETFEFLDTTYRIPSPSEEPISQGYYGGLLRARYSAHERLKGVWERNAPTENERMKRIAGIVEEAVTTATPLVLVEPIEESKYEDFESKKGILFDPVRAEIGINFAVTLAYSTQRKTYVIAPYREQVLHMKLEYERRYGHLMKEVGNLIRFSTVQKMLGSEADNIIAILGKERSGIGGQIHSPTIYFQEPELFNVQVSRHRRILVVIGNLRKLRKEAGEANQILREKKFEGIKVATEKMLELANVSWYVRLPREKIKREGEGAIYCRI